MTHRHTRIAGVVFVLVSAITPMTNASAQTDAEALRHFSAAIDEYVSLQRSLRLEVPLEPASDATTIVKASDTLALAIQRARPHARQGDFFTPAVRKAFQQRVSQALVNVNFVAITGANDPEERSTIRLMRTYARFPEDGPLATMPPSVLEALPQLPEELEYRFVSDKLILRDRMARLILDYMQVPVPTR